MLMLALEATVTPGALRDERIRFFSGEISTISVLLSQPKFFAIATNVFVLWSLSEAVHHDQGAFAQPLGKGGFQRAALHLGRQLGRPVARLRAVDVTAAFPEWRAQARDAGAPGAFLLPELPAAARDVAASLSLHSSLALIG